MLPTTLTALLLLAAAPAQQGGGRAIERVSFPTTDGVTVHADLFQGTAVAGAPVLVFFHDTQGSRGEARPIVKPLRQAGYVCLAVDLRVGTTVQKVSNLTTYHLPYEAQKDVAAAEADVIAALVWARERFPGASVVAFGCSYSASLALRVAGTRPELVDGVLAFSPAEYFEAAGKPATWVLDAMGGVRCPVLFLSARAEEAEWRPFFDAVASDAKAFFLPRGPGRHGLKALWENTEEGERYWAAVRAFLARHFPAPPPSGSDDPGSGGAPGGEPEDGG